MAFKPVTLVRGKSEVAVADSAARKVALEYDGWTVEPEVEKPEKPEKPDKSAAQS